MGKCVTSEEKVERKVSVVHEGQETDRLPSASPPPTPKAHAIPYSPDPDPQQFLSLPWRYHCCQCHAIPILVVALGQTVSLDGSCIPDTKCVLCFLVMPGALPGVFSRAFYVAFNIIRKTRHEFFGRTRKSSNSASILSHPCTKTSAVP